jgi:hypothetical protein
MDPTGKELNTISGGTYTGTRLSPEIPADSYDFQKAQYDLGNSCAADPPRESKRHGDVTASNAAAATIHG